MSIIVLALLFFGWTESVAPVRGAPPEAWEVLRVFIPDDQIDRLVTRAYKPYLIEELEQDLAIESARRKRALLETPALETAFYVSRMEGDTLASEHSRWQVRGARSPRPLELGTVSLALRPARGVAIGQPQLLDQAQFSATGKIELLRPNDNAVSWFGFVARPQSVDTSRRRFALKIPAATIAKMLIALPVATELSSPDVVVEKVSSPTAYLPEDWVVTSTASVGAAWQWWLVHLSGVSTFELFVEQPNAANLTWYKHLVRSAMVEYSASPGRLSAYAKFSVAGLNSGSPLRIRMGQEWRVEEVLVDGFPVNWRVQKSLSGEAHLLDLSNLPRTSRDVLIELNAFCVTNTDQSVQLPELAVAEAYTMDGEYRVHGRGELVTDNIEASGCQVRRIVLDRNSTSDSGERVEQLIWQAAWLGTPPSLTADFSKRQKPWIARSLTRFSVQSDWLSADCRMHINSSKVNSNEIRLPVGATWFIDSVRLVGASSDVRAWVEDRELAESPVIVISWNGRRESISLQLDVRAHSPRDTSADSFGLRSPRLVSLPGADQIDNYVIEASSRYSVQLSSALLRYQLQPVDLPDWQQQLLPTSADKWIFRGVRGAIPPVTLAASGGTYSCRLSTVVREIEGKFNADVTLRCLPISGSVDRLDVILPGVSSSEGLRWQLVVEGSQRDAPLSILPTALDASSRESRLGLELPNPISNAFTITTQIPLGLPEMGIISLPILGVPGATYGESLLVLPRALANPLDQTSIELLPAALCCTDSELSHLVSGLSTSEQEDLVAARLETGAYQLMQLQLHERDYRNSWIWSEVVQHRLQENGATHHHVLWTIENAGDKMIEVELPSAWQLEYAMVDGERIEAEFGADRKLLVELSQFSQSLLQLSCSSRHKKPGWLSYERLERPRISAPVLERSETLAIPPSRTALQFLSPGRTAPVMASSIQPLRASLDRPPVVLAIEQRMPADGASNALPLLVDRLLPSNWWRLLAPNHAWNDFSPSATRAGWSGVSLIDNSNQYAGAWTIRRSALSAVLLAAVLTLAIAFWVCLGKFPRRWWLTFSALIVLAVLVTSNWLPLVQLALLALACAGLLRLCAGCESMRGLIPSGRGGSGITSQLPRISNTWLIMFFVAGGSISAHAQNGAGNKPFSFASDTDRASDSTSPRTIFGVLIPVDDDGQLRGPFAYVPSRLLELLHSQADTKPGGVEPRVLSADYTLRTRRSLINQQEQLQELSVEFRLQVNDLEREIRLPFQSDQLTLQRGTANGQELFVGGRGLYQVADAIVFRPTSSGTLRLQMQLEARELTRVDGLTSLRCFIPPIANATLRIFSEGKSNFQLSSGSGVQQSVLPGATELLGPLSTLHVTWSTPATRVGTGPVPAEVFAETWLHGRGNRVSAICQLRIINARGLPRDLKIVTEPGWEPVGTSWADGELISNEVSSLGGRRVYTVRCPEDRSDFLSRTVRVVMVPRETDGGNTLTIPFFSLQEVSLLGLTRTLAWSREEDTTWRPDGLDIWQELPPTTSVDWGTTKWNVQPRLFRIPYGNMATAVRRVASPSLNTVDEITQVHLGVREMRITYYAQCQTADKRLVALSIPKSARVESILLDGNIPSYRVSERTDQALIEVAPRDGDGTFKVVQLELTQLVGLDRNSPLPRVVLRGFEANSSTYRVLAAAGLRCQVQSLPSLKLEKVSVRPSELLSNLETLVGQVDLRNEYRDSPLLPLRFTLQLQPETQLRGAVLSIRRSEQGWLGRVKAVWDSPEGPLDFAFFELPVAIRDTVNTGQMMAQFMPMGDSGHSTLRLIPPPPVDGVTQVEFEFPLPVLSSSQAVAIPRLAVLANMPIYPALALPHEIDQQPVQWLQTGRRLDQSTKRSAESILVSSTLGTPVGSNHAWAGKYEFYELETSPSQVQWKLLTNNPERAELLALQVRLLKYEANKISGSVDYWIQPGGQLNLPVLLPEQCTVLGVEIGGQPAIWQQEQSQVSVLLQPNYSPVNVRLLLHWETPPDAPNPVVLPTLPRPKRSPQLLSTVDNRLLGWHVADKAFLKTNGNVHSAMANRWARLLVATVPFMNGQSSSEVASWLKHWHPTTIGFDGAEIIDVSLIESELTLAGIDLNDDLYQGRSEQLWNAIRRHVGVFDDPFAGVNATWTITRQIGRSRQFGLLVTDEAPIELAKVQHATGLGSRAIAATLLTLASVLVLLLAQRAGSSYGLLLAVHPWIYWLQLGILAWLLLPVNWPSWILLATSAAIWVSQLMESRRRRRSLARV